MCLGFGLSLLILLRLVTPPHPAAADEPRLTCYRMTHPMEETSKEPQPTVSWALMKAHVPAMEVAKFSEVQSLPEEPAELSTHCLAREVGARYMVVVANHRALGGWLTLIS